MEASRRRCGSAGCVAAVANGRKTTIVPDRRPGRTRRRVLTNRLLAVAAIVVTLGALLAADRFVGRPDSSPPSDYRNRLVATPADSGSSTWFCAGGIATTSDAIADLRVILANPSTEPARGTVTFMGERGQRTSVPIVVPAQGRSELTSKDVLPVSDVAALVELNVGGVGVDHRLTRGTQSVVAPCTPTASDTWHFPLGVTTRDATTVISLFNPFAEDALLDFRFASDRGGARPTALQGFVVPAGSVRTVNVGSYVRRRTAIATTVSARVGRVIADEVIRFDGSGGPRGVTLVPGSPAVGRAWYFPAGRSTSVLKERYVLYNPSGADVQAHVDVVVAGGDIEPFVLDVPARDEVVLDLGDEARVPKNVDYSVAVSTSSKSGIVAGRLVDARSTFRRGVAGTLGSRIASDSWLIADAAASALVDDRIVVLNPTDTPAPLMLQTLSNIGAVAVHFLGGPTSDRLVVPPGGRLDIRLGDVVALEAGSIVVTTDGTPVVVERIRVAVAVSGPLTAREPADGASATAPVPRTAAPLPTTAAPVSTTAVVSTAVAAVSSSATPSTASPSTALPPTVSPPSGIPTVSSAAPAAVASGSRFGVMLGFAVASPSTQALPAITVPTPAQPTAAVPAPTTTLPAVASTGPSTSATPTTIPTTTIPTTTSPTSTTTTPTTTIPTTTTAVPGTRVLVGRIRRAALGTSAAIAIPLR